MSNPDAAIASETRRSDNLLSKMWRTKSSHFNARVRLERRHWLSITATSILSCYILALSLYQVVFEDTITKTGVKSLSVISIVVSIFLIMITLIESAKNYSGAADKMQRSAHDIAELYNNFQAMSLEDRGTHRVSFAGRYSDTLKRHDVIHKDIDFAIFKLSNATDLDLEWPSRIWLALSIAYLTVFEYWLYVLMIVLPPIAFWLALPILHAPVVPASAVVGSTKGS